MYKDQFEQVLMRFPEDISEINNAIYEVFTPLPDISCEVAKKTLLSHYGENSNLKNAHDAYEWFIEKQQHDFYCFGLPENCNPKDVFSVFVLSILYSNYKNQVALKTSPRQENIKQYYFDLPEFNKYKLVSLSTEREFFHTYKNTGLFDTQLNKVFDFQCMRPDLDKKLHELWESKHIGKLAFRLDNFRIHNGKYFLHGTEYGKTYPKIRLGYDELITKLYRDECYEDKLFIFIMPNEITIEELYSDLKIESDSIVTSVVHLLMDEHEGNRIITHIDHEFIFYTLEEYENKCHNDKQTGHSRKRIKTFKADECCIPIDPFFQFVLEECMEHMDLVYEFFNVSATTD